MIGLDCNILIQLALPDHPANPRTVSIVKAEAAKGTSLVFPPPIVTEFLHVATDDRRFSPPIPMTEALHWIERFLSNPSVRTLEPNRESLEQTFRWLRQFNLGRKRILDTHLAAVLHTNGVKRLLTSNPADFTVFGVLDVLTP